MKKIVLGILVALVAASPAVAAKKSKKVAAEPTVFERNEAGYRLVRDSLPVFLPAALIPFHRAVHQSAAEPKKSKRR